MAKRNNRDAKLKNIISIYLIIAIAAVYTPGGQCGTNNDPIP
jgi:hypothetical protein